MLKTATDKDLIRMETITFLKFGAKIRVRNQIDSSFIDKKKATRVVWLCLLLFVFILC
jgi:hypothetical protein